MHSGRLIYKRMNDKRKQILRYVLGAISLGFIVLTGLVLIFPFSFVDKEFSEELQEHHNSILDAVMMMISWFGYMPNSLIMVLVVAFVFFIFKYKREAVFTLTTLLSGLVSSGLKILINRPRPAESLVRILEKAKQQSFPSGHVLFYVVFFGFLAVLMLQLKTIPQLVRYAVLTFCMMLIFMVPFSRVYLGAHWFSDVLAGGLMGLLLLYVNSFFYLKKEIWVT